VKEKILIARPKIKGAKKPKKRMKWKVGSGSEQNMSASIVSSKLNNNNAKTSQFIKT
jgi:hypothetical protein